MSERRVGFIILGLVVILGLPFLSGAAAGQQEGALPPAKPMPVPEPGPGGIVGTSNADTSPARVLILPEVIWAPATGGGDWVSRLQLTTLELGTVVQASFFYGGTQTGYYTIFTSTVGANESATFTNILNTLGSLSHIGLYGQVGTVVLATQDDDHPIIADVETMNGNYGKSFPGLQYTDNNSVNVTRPGMIQDISNSATWRTGVGCWNGSDTSITMRFWVVTSAWSYVGNTFDITLNGWQFIAFNPFSLAGLGSSSLDGYRLYMQVQSTTGTSPFPKGFFIYGSKANNTTNDSCALFCKQYHM